MPMSSAKYVYFTAYILKASVGEEDVLLKWLNLEGVNSVRM